MRRAFAQVQARLKLLETAVKKFELPHENATEEFPTRAGFDSKNVDIDTDIVSQCSFLSNLYDALEISRFCVGTWPTNENAPNSICIHGMMHDSEGKPYEFNRSIVYPAMVKAQVPFSSIAVEYGQELPNTLTIKSILHACSSHLVQLTPHTSNIEEAITAAYLAGRGCENLYFIINGFNPLYLGTSREGPRNIVGPSTYPSMRERISEAHAILDMLAPYAKKYTRFPEFRDQVLLKDPSVLKKPMVGDVSERRGRWNNMIKESAPKTDYGIMVAASFLLGTQSPVHTEHALPVQIQTLDKGEEWLGMATMMQKLAVVLVPTQQTVLENPMRRALNHLAFF